MLTIVSECKSIPGWVTDVQGESGDNTHCHDWHDIEKNGTKWTILSVFLYLYFTVLISLLYFPLLILLDPLYYGSTGVGSKKPSFLYVEMKYFQSYNSPTLKGLQVYIQKSTS